MAMNEIRTVIDEGLKISGKYIFRDDFDSLENWIIVSGSPSVSGSILTLPPGGEIRTKRKWLYGYLVIVARSTASPSLRIGFDDGGTDYVVWSNNCFRYASTVDPTEGVISAGLGETSWNLFIILWEGDMILPWINTMAYSPYMGVKVPNKPLPICIKNIGTGNVQVDFVMLCPEPPAVWITSGSGIANISTVAVPVNVVTSTNRIGVVQVFARLLDLPYTDSTTPLGSNASFVGVARETQILSTWPFDYLAFINAHAVSDQPGTLMIQESPDGSTWVTVRSVPTSTVTNPDGTTSHVALIERHHVTLRYVRVAYRNGSTAQNTFRLSSRVYSI